MCSATTTLKQSKTDSTEQKSTAKPTEAAAQYTLYEVLYRILQLLAPVTPHLTEEIYQHMYARRQRLRKLTGFTLAKIQRCTGR